MYANNSNLYKKLDAGNIIPRMEGVGLINSPGRYVSPETGKIYQTPAIKTEPYWIYVNPNPEMRCSEFQLIVKGFRFIPQRCLECYKVVIAPRSFHELLLLLDLQDNMVKENPKFWCKCGVEARDFVPRNYGGYFYCKGLEVGRARYETVRKAVDENIGRGIEIILKRFCTEFEFMFGPSDKYVQPEGARELEEKIWANTGSAEVAFKQPEFIREHVIQSWMMFANGRGDRTVYLYNNGEPLFPKCVTYHQERG